MVSLRLSIIVIPIFIRWRNTLSARTNVRGTPNLWDWKIIDADYDHDAWRCRMAGMEQEPERGGRCLRCFKMRLQETARYAHEHGFPVITTTLASSRWKSLEQIEEAGRYATAPYPDVTYWEQNWRKGGLSERRIAIIKEYNFYNQQYCGCEFSMRKEEKEE